MPLYFSDSFTEIHGRYARPLNTTTLFFLYEVLLKSSAILYEVLLKSSAIVNIAREQIVVFKNQSTERRCSQVSRG